MKDIITTRVLGGGNTGGLNIAHYLRQAKYNTILMEEPTIVVHEYKLTPPPTIYTPPLTRRERRALERKNK